MTDRTSAPHRTDHAAVRMAVLLILTLGLIQPALAQTEGKAALDAFVQWKRAPGELAFRDALSKYRDTRPQQVESEPQPGGIPISLGHTVLDSLDADARADFTDDLGKVAVALDGLTAGGNTALYNAVYAGLMLGSTTGSRNLLLVFSDGADTVSWLGADAVQESAKRSETVIYSVSVQPAVERPVDILMRNPNRRWRPGELSDRTLDRNGFLSAIAAATGGHSLNVEDRDLRKAFSEVVKEFQSRYLLTYVPGMSTCAAGMRSR